MTFWTIMWITVIGTSVDGATFPIIYRSEAECEAARSAVGDTLHYDYSMECVVTEIMSHSVHPKPRPNR